MTPPLAVGSLVPDFDLVCTQAPGCTASRVKLADYRGRWLMLVFYPRDFSLVCPTELTSLSARYDEFQAHGCDIVGVSSDTLESHDRWVRTPRAQGGLGGLRYPLASDPNGDVCRSYGVYLEWQHVALRGLFLIDPNHVLQYMSVHNLSVGRRSDEIFRVLTALQTGGLCAENWTPELPPLDAASMLGPGSVFAHYRIDAELGAGSFARVFRAVDLTLERTVALKVLKPNSPVPSSAVLSEARVAASLNHPNICMIYSVDDSEGAPVIAMEYLSGRPLSDVLDAGPLPAEQARRLGAQLAEGLHAAHEQRIVHGDLKPANVFVTDAEQVKILDFGLARRNARAADPDQTLDLSTDGSVTGTPSYMSPEQAAGAAATVRSDVFALGTILYEMLTGRRAFPGENVLQVLTRVRAVNSEELAHGLPEPFGDIVRRALAQRAADRRIEVGQIAALLGENAIA